MAFTASCQNPKSGEDDDFDSYYQIEADPDRVARFIINTENGGFDAPENDLRIRLELDRQHRLTHHLMKVDEHIHETAGRYRYPLEAGGQRQGFERISKG